METKQAPLPLKSSRRTFQEKKWALSFEGYDVLRLLLGSILILAAWLKGGQLAGQATLETTFWNSRLFLTAAVLIELGFGMWLWTGLFRKQTWWLTILLFVIFFEVNLYHGLKGSSTCPCFGQIGLSPWLTLAADLLALAGLALCRPKHSTLGSIHLTAAFFLAVSLVGIPFLIKMVSFSHPGVVYSLRTDARLAVPVSLNLSQASGEEILGHLNQATQLTFAIHTLLETNSPEYGRILVREAPAWAVMEFMAQKQLILARWEETADGYHLRPAQIFGPGQNAWLHPLMALGAGVIVCAVPVSFVKRRTYPKSCQLAGGK